MPAAWRARGVDLAIKGQPAEGAAALARAVALEPRDPGTWSNIAAALLDAGLVASAIAPAHHALNLDARQAGAWNNLGNALRRRGDAVAARLAHAASIALDPFGPLAWLNLGVALRQSGGDVPAATAYRRAAQLHPAWSDAWVNLGNALSAMGDSGEADRAFSRAIDKSNAGALTLKRALLLPVVAASIDEIAAARARLTETISALEMSDFRLADPLTEIGQTAFHLAYHDADDRPLQTALAQLYLKAAPGLAEMAPHLTRRRGLARRRIRIAIVSELLHGHTIGRLFLGLIRHLDRARFEVIVIGKPGPDDPIRQAVRTAADHFMELPDTLKGARLAIGALEADILLYPDIGMTPLTYFLGFARLAPVQAVHWGHPDTTGIPNLDLFLSAAAMEPPEAERHYSEKLLRLPGPTLHLARAEATRSRPRGDPRIYLCPQTPQKLHPDFDAAIVAILRADPKARCVFVVARRSVPGQRLAARFAKAGPDVAGRIDMLDPMPHSAFLDLVASADVMLDAFHYSGGHTSLEAFSLGTPIVTWPGRFMRGRHTHGFYRLMEIAEATAETPEDYVRIALALANDPDRRRDLVDKILARNDALFERRDSINALGDALTEAVILSG